MYLYNILFICSYTYETMNEPHQRSTINKYKETKASEFIFVHTQSQMIQTADQSFPKAMHTKLKMY